MSSIGPNADSSGALLAALACLAGEQGLHAVLVRGDVLGREPPPGASGNRTATASAPRAETASSIVVGTDVERAARGELVRPGDRGQLVWIDRPGHRLGGWQRLPGDEGRSDACSSSSARDARRLLDATAITRSLSGQPDDHGVVADVAAAAGREERRLAEPRLVEGHPAGDLGDPVVLHEACPGVTMLDRRRCTTPGR